MLAAAGATPALGGRGLSPHYSGTGSGRNLPRVSRGDRSVRRRLPALVGRQRVSDPCFILIDDSHNKAPQALGTRTSAASVRDPGSVPWPSPGGKHDAYVAHSRQLRPHRDGTERPGPPNADHGFYRFFKYLMVA